jgi:topoisomerase-4 subunit B
MATNPALKTSAEYSEGSIRVLKGLEPVKQRPGMYTRTDNPLHVIQEVLDNAADEALAGHGKKIKVTLHVDGSVTVEDDGRGIPFGLHPEEKAPVIELVFTRLHAGGKFDKGKGGAYSFSGGLHGVGVSVTNALATRLEATSYREGKVARLVFSGGDVIEPLVISEAGPGERRSGTVVRVWPDSKYFESAVLPLNELTHLLRSKAVLMPGVSVTLTLEKTKEVQTWLYKGGLRDYLMQTLNGDPVIPLLEGEGFADGQHDSFAEGEGAAWCLAFTEDGGAVRESYVNLIPTSAGGTHELGLRDGVFNAVKSFIELHSLLPKGVKLMPEDVFARASYVLSAKVLDPQFQGQIKERLNSRDAVRLVSSFVRPALELWLNEHVEHGKKLAELAIKAAQTRQKAGQKVEKRKGSGVAVLPGKLTDCESKRHRLQRGLPGRRRLGRRQRQDGPRQGKPGHPAAARQGAQHLGGRSRPAVQEQRDPRHRGGHRRRPARARRHARPLRPALRQGLHPERRRCGWFAHPGASADALFPPLPQADRGRPRVCGPPAAVPGGRAGARKKSRLPRPTPLTKAN